MQPRTENARARRIFIPLFGVVALLSTVVRAAPAAAIDCQAAALSALGVADMTIDSATDVPAAAPKAGASWQATNGSTGRTCS